ncbi:SAM-dependent methyltransferase [Streptomyces sp. TLI_146]|uniref:SAM-dependent methyltransferase n=1 Tax=Streptomyces sp. TLI_146 TaxID=1938858 RepID=UPI000CBC9DD8|nr:SAM-dependent methyltransferase [Streptomyces sp. TLI_146]PKV82693.1 S-adenosyl methyltransferase [Streptomyces sp. TLI_146]
MTLSFLPQPAAPVPDGLFTQANSARLTDFCLGGGENYAVDRTLAAELSQVAPYWRLAVLSSRLHALLTVGLLARHGIRQYLDLGCGFPPTRRPQSLSEQPVYERVRCHRPEAVVVTVDSDPVVAAHARAAVFTPRGAPPFVAADLRDVAALEPVLNMFDQDRPIAVLLHDVLAWIPEDQAVHDLMRALRCQLPPGSVLSLTHATADLHIQSTRAAAAAYRSAQLTWRPRSGAALTELLGDWTLLGHRRPVPTALWHPAHPLGILAPWQCGVYALLATTPRSPLRILDRPERP